MSQSSYRSQRGGFVSRADLRSPTQSPTKSRSRSSNDAVEQVKEDLFRTLSGTPAHSRAVKEADDLIKNGDLTPSQTRSVVDTIRQTSRSPSPSRASPSRASPSRTSSSRTSPSRANPSRVESRSPSRVESSPRNPSKSRSLELADKVVEAERRLSMDENSRRSPTVIRRDLDRLDSAANSYVRSRSRSPDAYRTPPVSVSKAPPALGRASAISSRRLSPIRDYESRLDSATKLNSADRLDSASRRLISDSTPSRTLKEDYDEFVRAKENYERSRSRSPSAERLDRSASKLVNDTMRKAEVLGSDVENLRRSASQYERSRSPPSYVSPSSRSRPSSYSSTSSRSRPLSYTSPSGSSPSGAKSSSERSLTRAERIEEIRSKSENASLIRDLEKVKEDVRMRDEAERKLVSDVERGSRSQYSRDLSRLEKGESKLKSDLNDLSRLARSRSPSPSESLRSRSPSPSGSLRSRSPSPSGSLRSRSPSPSGSLRSRSPSGVSAYRSSDPSGSLRSLERDFERLNLDCRTLSNDVSRIRSGSYVSPSKVFSDAEQVLADKAKLAKDEIELDSRNDVTGILKEKGYTIIRTFMLENDGVPFLQAYNETGDVLLIDVDTEDAKVFTTKGSNITISEKSRSRSMIDSSHKKSVQSYNEGKPVCIICKNEIWICAEGSELQYFFKPDSDFNVEGSTNYPVVKLSDIIKDNNEQIVKVRLETVNHDKKLFADKVAKITYGKEKAAEISSMLSKTHDYLAAIQYSLDLQTRSYLKKSDDGEDIQTDELYSLNVAKDQLRCEMDTLCSVLEKMEYLENRIHKINSNIYENIALKLPDNSPVISNGITLSELKTKSNWVPPEKSFVKTTTTEYENSKTGEKRTTTVSSTVSSPVI